MTSTPTRIIAITLALLALSAPVAGAMPLRDSSTPVELTQPAPVTVDDGPSPLVFILPTIALAVMLGAAAIYIRSSRPARV